MRLLSTHTVHHSSENKYIRLYHGDLAAIPPEEEVDLLVISAFPNDYLPTSTSLIGALFRKGISVEALSQDKQVDLRNAFSCWLSKSLSERFPAAGFRQILCFEPVERSPTETVGQIFRVLMPFVLDGPPIRSVAMPIIAAGDQGNDAEIMLRCLFDAAVHWLEKGLPLQTIKFVVYQAELAESLAGLFTNLSADFPGALKDGFPSAPIVRDYDFFLSYAEEDSISVDILEQGIKVASPVLRLYRYKRELDPGQSWQEEIDHALESCRRVVVLLSPAYLDSPVCIEEFNMARLRHRESNYDVLKPIYLRTAPLSLYMKTLQHFDCRESDGGHLISAASKLASS